MPFTLDEAIVVLRAREEGATEAVKKVSDELRKLPGSAEESNKAMELMFGRMGASAENLEHSIVHAFGHIGRAFMAGGIVGAGVMEGAHLIIDVAKEWWNAGKEAEEAGRRMQESTDQAVQGLRDIESSAASAMRVWQSGLAQVMDKMREAEAEDAKFLARLVGGAGGGSSAMDAFNNAASVYSKKTPFQAEQDTDRKAAEEFNENDTRAATRFKELRKARIDSATEITKLEEERQKKIQEIDTKAAADTKRLIEEAAKAGTYNENTGSEVDKEARAAKDQVERDYLQKRRLEQFKIEQSAEEENKIAGDRRVEAERKEAWQAGLADRMKAANDATEKEEQRKRDLQKATMQQHRDEQRLAGLQERSKVEGERQAELKKRDAERLERTSFHGFADYARSIQAGMMKEDPLQREILKVQNEQKALLQKIADQQKAVTADKKTVATFAAGAGH